MTDANSNGRANVDEIPLTSTALDIGNEVVSNTLPSKLPAGHMAFPGCTDETVSEILSRSHSNVTELLDLREGSLTHLPGLDHPQWTSLTSLVVDRNKIEAISSWPAIAGLETLSLNANYIDELDMLCTDVAAKYPNLKYLSLLGNPCCPDESNGGNENAYGQYQKMVSKRLPQLQFLDFKRLIPATGPLRTTLHRLASLSFTKPSQPTANIPRRFSLVSKENSDYDLDSPEAMSPAAINVEEVALRKLDAKLITQAEYDHIVSITRQAEKSTRSRGSTPTTALKIPSGFKPDQGFASLMATLEAENHPHTPEEIEEENETLRKKLDAANALLEQEMEELKRQDRVIEINAREHALFPEPPLRSVTNESTTDAFSDAMSREGYKHRNSNDEDVTLTHQNLPEELDVEALINSPKRAK